MGFKKFLSSKKSMYLLVSIILSLHFIFALSSAWNLSPPIDFNPGMNAGYLFFSKGILPSVGLSAPAQGNLFALAPIILGIKPDDGIFWEFNSGNNKGLLAFYNVLDNNVMNKPQYDAVKGKEEFPRNILRLSYVIESILSVLTALIIFIWAKEAFGIKSGYMALLLYSFSPFTTSIVHGLHSDNLTRLLVALTLFSFWRFIKSPSLKNIIFASISLALALSAKTTTAYYPIILAALLIFALVFNKPFQEKINQLFKTKWSNKYLNTLFAFLLICIIAIFILNAAFLFKDVFKPIEDYNYAHYNISSPLFLSIKDSFIGKIPLPITSHYIMGLDQAKTLTEAPPNLYFLGKWYYDSVPISFYFVSFLLKTTLPVLILLLLIHMCFFLLLFSNKSEKQVDTKFVFIFLFFAIYFIFIFTTFGTKNVYGLRHLSMIYPLIFVLASGILAIRFTFFPQLKYIVWALVCWHIIIYLLAFPFFIPYFNEFIGNEGYLNFRDSNIDMNELYYYAIDYKKAHPELILFPECFVENGIITVSPRDLNFDKSECYGWLKNFEPIDFIGNSWPVYEVNGKWKLGQDDIEKELYFREKKLYFYFTPSPEMKLRKGFPINGSIYVTFKKEG